MTFKKSMISIAAASVIAAGLTGCGSSGSTAAVVAAAEDTTTAGTVTSVEAVDGKILNALATATYVDENNETQTITLESVKSSVNLITGAKTSGTYAYVVPESNISIADSIRFITIAPAAASISDGESYDAAYIDADLSGDYNLTVDGTPLTATYTAVKGVSYVSPISTLVYGIVKANLDDNTKDINATEISNAISKIALKLNLSADDVQNVDPLAAGKSEFGFVNAMLGNMTNAELLAMGTTLDAVDTNATDFYGVIAMLADNVPATQTALFTALEANIASGALTTEVLSTLNFDDTRAAGGEPVLATSSTTAIGNITAIETNSIAALTTGDKLGTEALTFTFAAGEATDANATGTVDLLLSIASPKATNTDTAGADKLVVKVSNLGVKRVSGTTTFDTNMTNVTTSYEWYTADADLDVNYVTKADLNSTYVNLSSVFTPTTMNLSNLVTAVDANLSGESNSTVETSFTTGNIVAIQAAIVDSSNLLQLIDSSSENAKIWTTASVAGTGNAIVGEGKSLLNATLDARSSTTALNVAPSVATVDVNGSGATAPGFTTTYAYNDIAAFTQIANVMTTANYSESNDTVVLSGLPTFITAGASTLVIDGVSGAASADFNLTVDTNLSAMVDTNTTVAIKVTDEFGKVNTTDANVSFFFDAIPTITLNSNGGAGLSAIAGSGLAYTADLNITEHNNTGDIVFNVANYMGDVNTSITVANNANAGWVTDINSTTGKGTFTLTDVNTSDTTDINITLTPTNGSPVLFDINTSL